MFAVLRRPLYWLAFIIVFSFIDVCVILGHLFYTFPKEVYSTFKFITDGLKHDV